MVAADARMEHSSDDVWHSQLRSNVEGTVATIKAVLPHMRERGWGRIVLLSSGAAQDGSPGMEAYATAKAAIGGLTLSLARSTGPSGVLVNAVLPGLVATERHKRTIPEEALAQIAQRTPTRRLTSEEDVAKLTAFLASNANQSVTGASIRISGGLRM